VTQLIALPACRRQQPYELRFRLGHEDEAIRLLAQANDSGAFVIFGILEFSRLPYHECRFFEEPSAQCDQGGCIGFKGSADDKCHGLRLTALKRTRRPVLVKIAEHKDRQQMIDSFMAPDHTCTHMHNNRVTNEIEVLLEAKIGLSRRRHDDLSDIGTPEERPARPMGLGALGTSLDSVSR
jgi:hypothetical protein